MCKSSKITRDESEPIFAKGMTLEQYMNKNMIKVSSENIDGQQVQEENLYESTINRKIQGIRSKNDLYFINEIDEESVEDSIENFFDQESTGLLKSQRTKETLLENNQISQNKLRPRINSISMNSTAFFKGSNQEKNTFRIKRMSVSPFKRKTEIHSGYGSITLYGNKFGPNSNKQAHKETQIMTFYGKLKHNTNESHQKEGFLPVRKQDSKGNFIKKHQIQLNQLLEYESNLNNKYIPKGNSIEMKVEGIKDRLNERKNKFC